MGRLTELKGCKLVATDGDAGSIDDVYFDDKHWTIRHLVVDTGGWLGGRKVLVSPRSVVGIDWDAQAVRVGLKRDQIERSPDIDTKRPLSRQHEVILDDYYGFPNYWSGPMLWGFAAIPAAAIAPRPNVSADPVKREVQERINQEQDPHLRSGNEVIGYDIRATDDSIGSVEDFTFNDEDWSISALVVDTTSWLSGKHVLVAPRRIEYVSWEDREVVVKLSREEVENSPELDSDRVLLGATHPDVYQRLVRGPME